LLFRFLFPGSHDAFFRGNSLEEFLFCSSMDT
jgi:hypothetical protein